MKAEEKTNVMRVLEQKKVPYKGHCYVDTDAVSGVEVAEVLGQDPAHVFKTLVTMGKTKQNYVFVIPVARELDLKKAAKAVGEKSIEMLKSKDLLPLTGYIHGGCSPVGMKKFFKTSGLLYKELGLKDKLLTLTGEEQIALLSTDGMLVKRPMLISDGFALVGFKEDAWEKALL